MGNGETETTTWNMARLQLDAVRVWLTAGCPAQSRASRLVDSVARVTYPERLWFAASAQDFDWTVSHEGSILPCQIFHTPRQIRYSCRSFVTTTRQVPQPRHSSRRCALWWVAMPDQIMLESALSGNVIDIKGNSTAQGALLDAFPSKAGAPVLSPQGGVAQPTPVANQAWEVARDPAGSSHFIIKNPGTGHCIDIVGNSVARGAQLDAFPSKKSNNENQLWDFLPDPNGSGYFFIQNPQTGYVIEIENGSSESGAPLVVNPWRLFDNQFQLWRSSGSTALPALKLAPIDGQLRGAGQYILLPADQTKYLIGTTVTLDIVEDLTASAFSVQINGTAPYPPPKGVNWDAQWSQFGMHMQDNSLTLFQQVWHALGSGGANNPLETQTTTSGSILQLQNNTVPAGTRIVLTLITDSASFVTGILGQAYNISGAAIGPRVEWSAIGQPNFTGGTAPESALSPLGALQVVVVGLPLDGHDHFTTGMGTITIRCATGLSAIATSSPNPHGIGTAENSNCYYGQVQAGNFQQIVQPFGVPRPRITSVPGIWTFVGAGLLPNSKLTVTGQWAQDAPELGFGKVLPDASAVSRPDGSFAVIVDVDNPNAPFAGGLLSVTIADSDGNWATGNVRTPTGDVIPVGSTNGLGPP